MAEGTGDEDNLQEADEELGRDEDEQGVGPARTQTRPRARMLGVR